jgi:hypothetical protein
MRLRRLTLVEVTPLILATVLLSSTHANTECERLDSRFIRVSPMWRFVAPVG